MEWLGYTKDIVVALSALAAAYFAYSGLSTWQKELRGKSQYQLSKEVLQSVFKVREAFKSVRHPSIYAYEYPDDLLTKSGHIEREDKYVATMHVYHERFKVLDAAFSELEDLFLKSMVEWGSAEQDLILEFRKHRSELMVSVRSLIDSYQDATCNDWMSMDERKRQSSVLYYTGDNGKYSDFTLEINQTVKKFEDWLRPHIVGK
ncbi:hypothetical protein BA893_06950 [Vibrio natriegens]|uniref:hypothetical protein n=1 Tax=Vibrio natriegens TaxID=691 RepID=UPI000803EB5C|nr:hypothetical protein [Vibrio natriegens]ANQ21418.1 hypothetical protein BA893_06950 [Vibrio natriegens]